MSPTCQATEISRNKLRSYTLTQHGYGSKWLVKSRPTIFLLLAALLPATAFAQQTGAARIVTEVVPFKEFYRAEECHQKHLVKQPRGYTCHHIRRMGLGE